MNCVVLFDGQNALYLEALARYRREDVNLTKIYSIGGAEIEEPSIEVTPFVEIDDRQIFDAVIILYEEKEKIMQLFRKLYGLKEITFYGPFEMMLACLTGYGVLDTIKRRAKLYYGKDKFNLEVGDFSYYTNLDIKDNIMDGRKVKIGKFSSLGSDIKILLGVEHRADWNTTYPFKTLMGIDELGESNTWSKGDVIIGNDVWIGQAVTILSGVTIGDGAIIGAGAVVAKSVEPYSVVVGNPGREVKKRFSRERIEKLLEMKWWDWDYTDLYEALGLLQSADTDSLYTYWKEKVQH